MLGGRHSGWARVIHFFLPVNTSCCFINVSHVTPHSFSKTSKHKIVHLIISFLFVESCFKACFLYSVYRREYDDAARLCSVIASGGSLPKFASGSEWERIWRHVGRSMAGLRQTWDFYIWFPYKMADGGQFVEDNVYAGKEEVRPTLFNSSFWSRGQPNGNQSTCLDCNDQGGVQFFSLYI